MLLSQYHIGQLNGASFDIAYAIVAQKEGGYVNDPNDKGGETYAGVAHNINPTWDGWVFIDFKKRTEGAGLDFSKVMRGHPWWNRSFPEINYLVRDFYLQRWNNNRFNQLNDQYVANLLYDYHVHSQSHAIRAVQNILGISADGVMGPQTVAAINAADPAALHDALKAQRRTFLQSLVNNNASQAGFLNNWMARVDSFPDLTMPSTTSILALVLIATAVGITYYQVNKHQRKVA